MEVGQRELGRRRAGELAVGEGTESYDEAARDRRAMMAHSLIDWRREISLDAGRQWQQYVPAAALPVTGPLGLCRSTCVQLWVTNTGRVPPRKLFDALYVCMCVCVCVCVCVVCACWGVWCVCVWCVLVCVWGGCGVLCVVWGFWCVVFAWCGVFVVCVCDG